MNAGTADGDKRKPGDVVFVLGEATKSQVNALLEEADALRRMIVKLSVEASEREKQAWKIVQGVCGAELADRSFEYRQETGEVLDMGPKKVVWTHGKTK